MGSHCNENPLHIKLVTIILCFIIRRINQQITDQRLAAEMAVPLLSYDGYDRKLIFINYARNMFFNYRYESTVTYNFCLKWIYNSVHVQLWRTFAIRSKIEPHMSVWSQTSNNFLIIIGNILFCGSRSDSIHICMQKLPSAAILQFCRLTYVLYSFIVISYQDWPATTKERFWEKGLI